MITAMAQRHPKEASEDSVQAFATMLPTAKRVAPDSPVFALPSGHTVRVKRATKIANQVHALWGEPLVIHVPRDPGPDRWFVVPARWQVVHALSGIATPHHALHPIECMQIKLTELDPRHEVQDPANDLLSCCETAAADARHQRLRNVINELEEARALETERATAALHEALQGFRAKLIDD